MGWANLLEGRPGKVEAVGVDTSNTRGTVVARSTSTYVQLTAATGIEAAGFIVTVGNDGTYNTNPGLLSIALGGSGSEKDIVKQLPVGGHDYDSVARLWGVFPFPIGIPRGKEIRVLWDHSSVDARVAMWLFSSPQYGCEPFRRCTFEGIDSGNKRGTSVTAGTSNSKSRSQIVASTARNYRGLVHVLHPAGSVSGGNRVLGDLEVGGAGSEKIIAENLFYNFEYSGADEIRPFSYVFPNVQIPSGSRLAWNSQCHTGTAPPSYCAVGGLE